MSRDEFKNYVKRTATEDILKVKCVKCDNKMVKLVETYSSLWKCQKCQYQVTVEIKTSNKWLVPGNE